MNRAIRTAILLGLCAGMDPVGPPPVKTFEPGFLQPEPKRDKPDWMKKAKARQRRKKGRK